MEDSSGTRPVYDSGPALELRRPHLLPDQPISSPEQDEFGRLEFARLLSERFAYPEPNCLVTALYGPWGSGKSSLLNLLAGQIHASARQDGSRPVIVRFNPWNFLSLDQLVAMFFRELGTGLGQAEPKLAKNVAKGLEMLSVLLAPGEFAPVGGSYFKLASRVAKRVSEALHTRQQTLVDIKDGLNKEISKLGRRVFVLIDDVDRLDRDSMRLMFRLIRLNADFDQLTYILAFDRKVVEQVLSEEQGTSGREYLEKIVQVGFDIPPPDPRKLKRMLLGRIESFSLRLENLEEEAPRWIDMQVGGLERLIKTPRDIIRYANSFQINGIALSGEVNPVDLAGLEAVRAFAPSLYSFIRDNRDILVGQAGGAVAALGHPSKEESKRQLDEAIAKCDPTSRGALREICEQLFPEIECLYRNVTFGGEGWRRSKRICTVDFFSHYFYLRPPEGEISNAEFQATMADGGNLEKLREHLQGLISGGRIDSFLDLLADASDTIAKGHIEPISTALFDVGDGLSWGFLSENQLLRLSRAVFKLLGHQPEQSRFQCFQHVAQHARSLAALVCFANLSQPDQSPGQQLFNDAQWVGIRDILLDRIRVASRDETLSRSPHLSVVLFRWRDWASLDEPREFVRRLIETDEGLLTFLCGMLARRARPAGRYSVRQGWFISLEDIQEFIAPATLTGRVQNIKTQRWDVLPERQKTAIDAFVEAISGEGDSQALG